MTSGKFSLQDGGKAKTVGIAVLIVLVAIAGIIVGIYAFRSNNEGCESPELDAKGLSNYTEGAKTVAFACFPGFFVDIAGTENYVISKCIDHKWNPEPPACNYLPLRLDCRVEENGLDGSITMIQMGLQNETQIFGFVKYEKAIKTEGHINEVIPISRHSSHCSVSTQYNVSGEIDDIGKIDETYLLKVQFESLSLAAYRTAEIRINMIYLDVNTTATLISVHQGNYTDVMKQALPSFGWNSNKSNNNDVKEKTSNKNTTTLTTTNGTIPIPSTRLNSDLKDALNRQPRVYNVTNKA